MATAAAMAMAGQHTDKWDGVNVSMTTFFFDLALSAKNLRQDCTNLHVMNCWIHHFTLILCKFNIQIR